MYCFDYYAKSHCKYGSLASITNLRILVQGVVTPIDAIVMGHNLVKRTLRILLYGHWVTMTFIASHRSRSHAFPADITVQMCSYIMHIYVANSLAHYYVEQSCHVHVPLLHCNGKKVRIHWQLLEYSILLSLSKSTYLFPKSSRSFSTKLTNITIG